MWVVFLDSSVLDNDHELERHHDGAHEHDHAELAR